jgi:3'(2'), 5'-bisphosphate nucleotidase
LNELFFSTKEGGAFKVITTSHADDFQYLQSNAVKLPIETKKEAYTVVASKSHMSVETEDYVKELEKTHGKVELISRGSSLKLCMVAEGKADCYPRFAPTMEWDTAAGQAICMHAGFEVIDWSTQKEMLYNRENLLNNWFLVR